jgi:hypothetical protein
MIHPHSHCYCRVAWRGGAGRVVSFRGTARVWPQSHSLTQRVMILPRGSRAFGMCAGTEAAVVGPSI